MSYIGQRPVVGRYIKLDQISSGFNGSNTSFSMAAGSQAVSPGTARNLLLSLGGVIQEPDTDYTVLGSTLTFTTAPAAGSSFFGIVFGDMQTVSTLSDGTVTPASISSTGDFSFPADIRLKDSDGSHYVGFQSPATVSSNIVWTLPSADAAASGYALVSNGSGTLSWAAMSGGISGITIQEEGSSLSTAATTLNFVGSNITAAGSGTTKTITVVDNTDSYYNTFLGIDALDNVDSNGYTNQNVAIGYHALTDLQGGSSFQGYSNVAVGYSALKDSTTGFQNTYVGNAAGWTATTAYMNTAIGHYAHFNLTSGSSNVAIGVAALQNQTTSDSNVALGKNAGQIVTTGQQNTFLGSDTTTITTGSNNTLLGFNAAASSATVSNEVTVGSSNVNKFRIPGCNFILKSTTATDNYVLTVDSNGECGWEAAAGGGLNSDAQRNTVGGTDAGASFSGTNAVDNTLFGYKCGENYTTGDYNYAFGYRTLHTATTSSHNCGFGRETLYSLTSGTYNKAFGNEVLYNLTTGNFNVGIGSIAGYQLTTGSDNTFLGKYAGSALTTGSNNTIIGAAAQASSNTVSNEITLGDANITKLRVPGIDVVLKDNGGTPTQGHVLTVDANGEASFEAASGGGISGITIQEEGSSLSTAATTLNFIGSNVTAAGTGATKSISLTSLPSGSNTQVQFNSSGVFAGSSNLTFDGTSLSVGGTVSATSSASGTAGLRKITASTSSPSGGSDGDIWLKYDTNAATSYLPIDSNNVVKINTTGTGLGGKLQIADGSGTDADTLLSLKHIGTGDGNGIEYQHNRAGSGSTAYYVSLRNSSGTQIGTITGTSSSIAYNTSSDYRLKENASAISDGITRLKTLKPYRFNFKADTSTVVDGFFAHEVTAVPEAITGTKDAVDSDNNPIYQSIDQSKLVPLLTAALQEAVAKIEVLESKVATLEAA